MNLQALYITACQRSERWLGWLPSALARISLGVVFVQSGWGKTQNFDKVIEYFTSLGIPAPAFNAYMVGFTELICGTLILIGLVTRLAAIPLLISMIVAILTAKWADLSEITDLFGIAEYLYVILLAWIAIHGPGLLSIDRLIFKGCPPRSESGR